MNSPPHPQTRIDPGDSVTLNLCAIPKLRLTPQLQLLRHIPIPFVVPIFASILLFQQLVSFQSQRTQTAIVVEKIFRDAIFVTVFIMGCLDRKLETKIVEIEIT